MDRVGMLILAALAAGVALLCMKMGIITAGGLYIERTNRPRMFIMAVSIIWLMALLAIVGAVLV